MKALTISPDVAGTGQIRDIPEPPDSDGALLVEGLDVGVCGTDREIIQSEYGQPPDGDDFLVLGHESLGRVVSDASSTFAPGDLVVGIVRHPDPVPCVNCAADEWDMCRNGRYTEHGIKGLHGFARERYRLDPAFAVRLDPSMRDIGVLMEPTTIVAKAWEHIDRIGERAIFEPRSVLVTGAGPVGLLAALLGAQRGLDVHVLDRVAEGPKPNLVAALGGRYHYEGIESVPVEPDIIIECTGVTSVIADCIRKVGTGGTLCLAGVSAPGHSQSVDIGAVNRELVLENNVVFGTVNANRRHYEQAAEALADADRSWLRGLITRRLPLVEYDKALEAQPDDVKVVLDIAGG